jgi:hypothetical protein
MTEMLAFPMVAHARMPVFVPRRLQQLTVIRPANIEPLSLVALKQAFHTCTSPFRPLTVSLNPAARYRDGQQLAFGLK